MATVTTTYTAKKATALTNPLTNDSIFVQSDNSAKSAFVSLYQLVQGAGVVYPAVLSFYVRAAGLVTTGTSSTLIVKLYYSTGASGSTTFNGTGVTATTVTFTSGAIATASQNWQIDANLYWDFTSKVLNGSFTTVNPASATTCQVTAQTAITSLTTIDLTALSSAAPIGGPGLILGAHFGSTNAGNVVTLSEFSAGVI